MLRGGDQHTLLHQAGGVTHTSDVAAAGLDFEAVQVGPAEDNSCARRRGEDTQSDGRAAVEAHAATGDCGTNCLLVRQREGCKSFNTASLLLTAEIRMWLDCHTWPYRRAPFWLSCSNETGIV